MPSPPRCAAVRSISDATGTNLYRCALAAGHEERHPDAPDHLWVLDNRSSGTRGRPPSPSSPFAAKPPDEDGPVTERVPSRR